MFQQILTRGQNAHHHSCTSAIAHLSHTPWDFSSQFFFFELGPRPTPSQNQTRCLQTIIVNHPNKIQDKVTELTTPKHLRVIERGLSYTLAG
jgi:hypothetical protein